MSTIRVTTLSINKSSQAVNRFSDTFNRASGNLGQNWIQTMSGWTPITNPVTSATFSIGAATDLAQAMLCTPVGTANPGMYWGAGLICAPLYMSCFGRSQFSEWQLISLTKNAGNDLICGPACMMMNSGQQAVGVEQQGLFAYNLIILTDLSFAVRRGSSNVNTVLAGSGGGAGSFAFGDIVRLECTVNTSDVTVVVKKNGTVLTTTVDNSASRLLIGSPGWTYILGIGNSAAEVQTCQWRNFNGGLL